MAHIRQSLPDSGLVFQAKALKILRVVASLVGSGAGLENQTRLAARTSSSDRHRNGASEPSEP